MLRLALEARTITGNRSGIGTYAYELATQLAQLPNLDIDLLAPGPVDMSASAHTSSRISQRIRPGGKLKWFFYELNRHLKGSRPDLVHFTNPVVPPGIKTLYVMTIHDMSLHLFRQWAPVWKQQYSARKLQSAALNARHILTVSNPVKRDIVKIFDIPEEKVTVTQLAASSRFFSHADKASRDAILKKYSIEKPFVLYTGAIEPRKNLHTLIDASKIWQSESVGKDFDLVLCGPYYHSRVGRKAMMEALEGKGIRHLGYVPAEELPLIYQAASLFIYPSFYEGFGIPVLEAMASRTPVIISNDEALQETAGDAAVVSNPDDTYELAHSVIDLLQDSDKLDALKEKGWNRANEFSWKTTAKQTLDVYNHALEIG